MRIRKALNDLVRAVLNRTAVPVARHVARNKREVNVLRELEGQVARECAAYATERMATALQFETKEDLRDFALGHVPAEGLVLEFGVWKGSSINHIAKSLPSRTVYGFDSFLGLKEDWSGWELRKGHFSLGGRPPKVASNVRLLKGWFDQTLPGFLAANPGALAFVHVDCDTYPAARDLLGLIGARLAPGTIVVFDEYFGYRGWRNGEHKAWQECVSARNLAYEYVAFSTGAVAVRVL